MCLRRRKYLEVVLIIIYLLQVCYAFECLSPDGKPIDWFIVYKLPLIPKAKVPLAKDGVGFYYMDVNNPEWKLSSIGMNESHGHAVYNTLQQIYRAKDNETFTYAFYNDQPPNREESENHGHTKGGFGFEKTGGFWLIMSIPHFPPPRDEGYSFPESAQVYGQSILCISLQYSSVETIANLMKFTYPKFFDYNLPKSFADANPNLHDILNKEQKHVTTAPFQTRTIIRSKNGQEFQNYAKASGFEADLYDSFVSCGLKTSVKVETWQNGPKAYKLPSNCSVVCGGLLGALQVLNVMKVSFPVGDFIETKDHSKWAVSNNGQWTCIGDINRLETQFHRGGSTSCFQNSKVWKAFTSSISQFENCTKTDARNYFISMN